VVSFAGLLRADGPVDLSLLVLPGLAEHRQQHDPPTSSSSSKPYSSRIDPVTEGEITVPV
jgi:hypothetical protein